MDDRQRVAAMLGSPVPVELGDGKVYRFSPLSIGELEELATYCRYARLRAVEAQTRDMDAETRERLVDRAYDECAAMPEDQLAQAIRSIAGSRYLLYLGFRHNHPELTLDALSLLVNPASLPAIMRQINEGSGQSDPT